MYLFTIIIWGENEMGFYLAEMEIMVIVWYFLNFTLTYQFFFLESYTDGDLKLLICVFSLKVGMGR